LLRLSDASIEWALRHVVSRGDTDIFPLPFEYSAITEDWDAVKPLLLQDLDAWAVRPHRKALTPKHSLGLRPATQLDPLDTLVYTALVWEIGEEFESVRVPKDEGRVFSYRFLPDAEGQLYDPDTNYESFRLRSLDLAKGAKSSFVVMTDIADFFPRIYSHPMENAMRAASARPDHARVLTKIISAWNMGVSYGIPTGPSASRLISEVSVADVDQALLAEQINFCRFSDDYRLFVPNERAARESLTFLANVLYSNHGLTLQESKTEIIPVDEFADRFERAERDRERHELSENFRTLAEAIGMSSGRYEMQIEYDDLDESLRQIVDSLNLWAIVERESKAERPLDIPMMRFVLGRIRQLGLVDEDAILLREVERFAPVFREVVEALVAQRGLSSEQLTSLGRNLLELFDHSAVGHLGYHREWLLTPFVNEAVFNHTEFLIQAHDRFSDENTRRAITLALGRGGVWHWFKTRKQQVFEMSPWSRRAFLYAASCLPGDESNHWYQSLRPRLEPLDQAVIKYARANPVK
jgi:hypothetical protein